jgi:hypothetical protein
MSIFAGEAAIGKHHIDQGKGDHARIGVCSRFDAGFCFARIIF